MEGKFGVSFEVTANFFEGEDIPEEDKEYISEKDRKYILKMLKEFNWKSLQRLPESDEEIVFYGDIVFVVSVMRVCTTVFDEKYHMEERLWYTIYLDDCEIIQRNS